MTVVLALLAAAILVWATVRLFLRTPPARLAAFLRRAVPVTLILAGGGLTLLGRVGIGIPLLGFGIAAWRRLDRRSARSGSIGAGAGVHSAVRSDSLEMVLDHDSGELDGEITAGPLAGRSLSSLTQEELRRLHRDFAVDDAESLRLLEAYLDRRAPGWRADFQAGEGGGLGGAPGAGAMTEQQAHQILGLQPGATVAEIRDAHRRLMKRVHPDHGGTDFLAARINEAKAFLIDRHG